MIQLLKKWCYNSAIIKKSALALFFITITLHSHSQVNLIPNPSFEDTLASGISISGIIQLSVSNWHNLDSTKLYNCISIYLSEHSPNGNFILPNNFYFFNQYAKSGIAFNGLTIYNPYIWLPVPTSLRSVASTRLKQKLVAGKKYCAKAFLSPSDYEGYFTDGFGMYFDNGQLDTIVAKDSSGIYTFVTPQVQAQQIINDTVGWTKVSNTFIATGLETHVHLGNWLADSAMQFQPNNPAACECQDLGVDDVSLIAVDIANWLRDTSVTLTDSVYIGLPKYEVPDAIWYTYNMQVIDTASGIWVKPTQAITQYIQAIDVCDRVAYDTVTVYANPVSIGNEQLAMSNLRVYPNPASEQVTIQNIIGKSVIVFNTIAAVVHTQLVQNHQAIINTSQWAKGVYVLKNGRQIARLIIE